MTNKEAIEEIRSCLGVNNIIEPYSDEMIAFGMAIGALQMIDELKTEIKNIKKLREQGCLNYDFANGYICALSTVEGMIAEMESKNLN